MMGNITVKLPRIRPYFSYQIPTIYYVDVSPLSVVETNLLGALIPTYVKSSKFFITLDENRSNPQHNIIK